MTELHPLYQEVLASGDAYLGDDGVVRVSRSSRRWRHWEKDYPLIVDASGTRLRPYKRVTTHIKTTDVGGGGLDTYKIALALLGIRRDRKLYQKVRDLLDPAWSYDDLKEQLLLGVDGEPVTDEHGNPIKVWDEFRGLIDELQARGGGKEATSWGDLIHKITEVYEENHRELKPAEVLDACNSRLVAYREAIVHSRGTAAKSMKQIVGDALQDLEAYAEAMKPFEVVAQEFFVVNDDLQTAGSGDCLVRYPPMDELIIADKKTGKNAMNYLGSKAMQKAEYAHGTPYSFAEGRQSWDRPISDRWGLLIALPGDGTCRVNWVNIAWGWDEIVETFPVVEAHKDYRTQRGLLVPFRDGEVPVSNYEPRVVTPKPEPVPVIGGTDLLAVIASARTIPELNRLWSENKAVWSDELTKAAATRKGEINALLNAAGTQAA